MRVVDQPEPKRTERTDERHRQLSWIEGELGLYGLAVSLDDREVAPHVVVFLGGTYGERVYLSKCDGRPVYSWAGSDATHSVADPAGAARRIATALRREQRESGRNGGRDTELYRMRLRRLRGLAQKIEDAGYPAVVTEPPGMPVLRIRRPGMSDLDVLVTVGHDWQEWFCYRRECGGEIVPAPEVDEAALIVLARLRNCHWEGDPRVGVDS